jgi:predicted sulfurtransferase
MTVCGHARLLPARVRGTVSASISLREQKYRDCVRTFAETESALSDVTTRTREARVALHCVGGTRCKVSK